MKRILLIILICLLLPIQALAVTYGKTGESTNFNGDVGVPTGKGYYVNGVQVTSAILSDVASIAMLDEAEEVTGEWILIGNPTIRTVSNTNTAPPLLSFQKAAIETDGDVTQGDYIMKLNAYGFHGVVYQLGATIRALVSDTPGDTTDMPTKLEFLTSPDGTSTPVLAMTISEAQVVTFANDLTDAEISDTLTSSTCTGTAAVATAFTATDNDTENLACPIVFVDGATGTQGGETDTDLTYNPNSGTVAATIFDGSGQADFASVILDTPLSAAEGGTGVANHANETITLVGDDTLQITTGEATTVTLPASGTLYGTLADSISSANLLGSVSDEQGTGVLVFATSPTLVTPALGAATATSINAIEISLGASSVASNLAIGTDALQANTSGANNFAAGYQALYSNEGGGDNFALGYQAMYSNSSGNYNFAAGKEALYTNTGNYNNTAIGLQTLYYSTGVGNTGIGTRALFSQGACSNNLAIGVDAGRYQANGSTGLNPNNSTYIGTGVRGYDDNDDNSIVIGYNAIGVGPNKTVIGNSSITDTYLSGNIHAVSSAYIQTVVTMDDGDLTPDVSAGNIFISQSNTGATAISDLDNPVVGQIVTLIVGNATNPPTIADSGNFALSAAWTPDLDDVLVLFVQADNDYIEISRSTN